MSWDPNHIQPHQIAPHHLMAFNYNLPYGAPEWYFPPNIDFSERNRINQAHENLAPPIGHIDNQNEQEDQDFEEGEEPDAPSSSTSSVSETASKVMSEVSIALGTLVLAITENTLRSMPEFRHRGNNVALQVGHSLLTLKDVTRVLREENIKIQILKRDIARAKLIARPIDDSISIDESDDDDDDDKPDEPEVAAAIQATATLRSTASAALGNTFLIIAEDSLRSMSNDGSVDLPARPDVAESLITLQDTVRKLMINNKKMWKISQRNASASQAQ